jgi:hypothetical protein
VAGTGVKSAVLQEEQHIHSQGLRSLRQRLKYILLSYGVDINLISQYNI